MPSPDSKLFAVLATLVLAAAIAVDAFKHPTKTSTISVDRDLKVHIDVERSAAV